MPCTSNGARAVEILGQKSAEIFRLLVQKGGRSPSLRKSCPCGSPTGAETISVSTSELNERPLSATAEALMNDRIGADAVEKVGLEVGARL